MNTTKNSDSSSETQDITADKVDPVESHDPDGKLCPIDQQKAFLEGFEAAAYCYSELPKNVDHYAVEALRDWLKEKAVQDTSCTCPAGQHGETCKDIEEIER